MRVLCSIQLKEGCVMLTPVGKFRVEGASWKNCINGMPRCSPDPNTLKLVKCCDFFNHLVQ
jgi:hypothetical protein